MNQGHLQFLSSPEWARLLETDLFPWVDSVGDLGDDVLEIGPGPGLTTDLLRRRVEHLTAIEIDETLALALRRRLKGADVEVICADATASGLPAGRFSAATCFSMLHHVPSAGVQDRIFAEVHRLLRPGGVFLGVDSLDVDFIRDGHVDDIFVPVDPGSLPARLEEAGFVDIAIEEVDGYQFRFVTRRRPSDAG